MGIQERIRDLIRNEESIPVKDKAGIITAHGIDATVRRRALQQCLDIVIQEEGADNDRNNRPL